MHPGWLLVVEDDVEIRETLVEILEEREYNVSAAEHGKLALELLRRAADPPCLILLDMMMPVMDGRAFHAELRRHPAWVNIPVVICSAYRDLPAPETLSPQVEYLKKPLDLHELIKTVRRHCPD